MTALLIVRESGWLVTHGQPGIPEIVQEAQPGTPEESWYGVYLESPGGKLSKIGYVMERQEKLTKGYLITGEGSIKVKMQGVEVSMRQTAKVLCDSEMRLLTLDIGLFSDVVKFRVFGRVEKDIMNLEIETGGGKTVQKIPLKKPPVVPDTIEWIMAHEGLAPGKKVTLPFFDPTTLDFDEITVQVEGREEVPTSNGSQYLWKLVSTWRGITMETWIDDRGRTIKKRAAGMVTVLESKETALSEGWGSKAETTDIISTTKISTNREIDNARNARYLKVRLSGVDFQGFMLDGDRQSFDPATGILVVHTEPLPIKPTYNPPFEDKNRFTKELASEPTLQSDDPDIRMEAVKISLDAKDALDISMRLSDWVFKTLEKKPLMSIPSAKDVLIIKRGDCNEHAQLLAALGRAKGIPTRVTVGIVYNEGAFYYHAWDEFWLGSWVSADATLGQFPSDATHIRFLTGGLSDQIPIIRLMGRLQVEVLEAS